MLRYRLAPLRSDEEWSIYEGEDDQGNRFDVTAKSYYRRLFLARSIWDVHPATDDLVVADVKLRIRTLVKLGCDRGRLYAWLRWLARSEPSLTKTEDAVAAEAMQKASEYAFRLELSALRWKVNPDGHFDGLSNVLGVYADRLKRLASSAGLRDP